MCLTVLKIQEKMYFSEISELLFCITDYCWKEASTDCRSNSQTKKEKASESDPVSTVTGTNPTLDTATGTITTPGIATETNPINIEIGHFVALRLKEYDDEVPQIARVTAIRDLDVDTGWWIGQYNDTWNQ